MFRPKIGLALGGGGPRGLAHIGVIKVLEKHSIPIDYIAGTSAGALIGGLYAYSKDISSIETYIMEKNWVQMLSYFADPSLKGGIIKGNHIEQFLDDYLHSARVEDTKITFHAAAVDIQTSKLMTLHEGSLSKAIRASCAIPILFKPVEINNHHYLDGGLISAVPVQMVKKMGADIVIAVQLHNKYSPGQKIDSLSIQEVGELALNIVEENIANEEVKQADFVIKPPVGHISWNYLLQQDKKREVIDMGEKTTLANIASIALIVEKNKIGLILHNWINNIKKLF